MNIKIKWIAGIELAVIFALLAFIFFHHPAKNNIEIPPVSEVNSTGLLSMRVYRDILEPKSLLIVNFDPLREKLNEYIATKNGNISFYLVNLRDGASMEIDGKRGFVPASLNKVPTAILIMKKIERGELSFDTMIDVKDSDRDSIFGSLYPTKEKELPVRFLLEKMLKESDNTAFRMLLRNVDENDMKFLLGYLDYHSLDMTLPNLQNDDNSQYVSPKSMYGVFSSLYLSTLLKPENSEYILSQLTDTSFDIKKTAQLPDDVRVSHKFAAYTEGIPYFHDCGIIYIDKGRFFYCVMTEGLQPEEGANAVKTIVHLSYQYIVNARAQLDTYQD